MESIVFIDNTTGKVIHLNIFRHNLQQSTYRLNYEFSDQQDNEPKYSTYTPVFLHSPTYIIIYNQPI